MPRWMTLYVHYVDAVSRCVGKVALYLIFVMMGILLYAVLSRAVFNAPVIWAMEMSQFTMVAYYLLGGAFSMLLRAHVRMDVLYCRWRWKTQAKTNIFTSFFLIIYLALLLYGSVSSTIYSIQSHQHSYSAWAPAMAPVKCIMVLGIFLMLLQSISDLFKEIARARGMVMDGNVPEGMVDEFDGGERGMRAILIPDFVLPPHQAKGKTASVTESAALRAAVIAPCTASENASATARERERRLASADPRSASGSAASATAPEEEKS